MTMYTGSKFEAGRDVAEIARLVRADIKAAIKAGTLPSALKTRVKINRFAGGCALDVIVTGDLKVKTIPCLENRRLYTAARES